MSEHNDGGSAFPNSRTVETDFGTLGEYGMSLRDYMAIHAPELIPNEAPQNHWEKLMGSKSPDSTTHPLENLAWWDAAEAKRRYMRADAMIAERSKK